MPKTLSSLDKFRLLMDWLPALQLAQAVAAAPAGRSRVAETIKLLQFAAAKTDVAADDEVVQLVGNALMTEEGGKLVDYLAEKIKVLIDGTH
jgi:hypothetical protein